MTTPDLAAIFDLVNDNDFAGRVKAAAFVLRIPFAPELVWHAAATVMNTPETPITDEEIFAAILPENQVSLDTNPQPIIDSPLPDLS